MIIAIDGPAAAGKGTLARRLAEAYGFALLDTGLLYRAVGMKVVAADGDLDDEEGAARAARALRPDELSNPALRSDAAAQAASKVAAIAPVRAALLDFQRTFAHQPPSPAKGAILDGRDIATTVCPDAEIKLFVTASAEIRAKRRYKELLDRGLSAIYARVLEDLEERDARDKARAVSPLVAAPDALVIDTSAMDADRVFATAVDFIKSRNVGERP
ncbi:(d)CMP kinase [Varunaivibrio sulfuroxidans]|uniref:Cytidylate kinase n=1 Tax=Varunaivibrio sulfuroxidans TaxID=1773489 RepID=A0A4R3J8D9_9PROT|nr:(d)CMP kinase [Varunaivibrio sulfuroxidans]TCS61625.1 cytidylate kinase [Varunaivibrio sulfuroxidans]WES29502.1 (d)CMP kinase [Varunaivibrio sulfuroxidans]